MGDIIGSPYEFDMGNTTKEFPLFSEDVIRTAVSLGGDCDTLTAIAGSIAEGFYGISDELKQECRDRLPQDLLNVLVQFENFVKL